MKVKNENYICLQGWMINELGLKGNDLIVYAVIYSFSQDGDSWFYGSLDYLADWCNCTVPGVSKNIQNLLDRGLLVKEKSTPTNRYKAIDPTNNKQSLIKQSSKGIKQSLNGIKQSYNGDIKQSLNNNIDNNINNNINISQEQNKYEKDKILNEQVENVIQYFNKICNTKFRSTSIETKKLIKARLKEGFSLQDFYNVIECKYKDWGEKPVRFSNGQLSSEYLRPGTLFASAHFESYVHEATIRRTSEATYNSFSDSIIAPVDPDRSNITF